MVKTTSMNDTHFKIHGENLWHDSELSADTFVLDVRTPAEYAEAHIPGSVNVPLGDLHREVPSIREYADSRPIAVVCRTGKRAANACETLVAEELPEMHVLEGGIVSWVDAGLPVTRGAKAISLERQVRIAAGALVVLGVLLGFTVAPGFFGLSGFVGAGLVFAGVTDTCGMAMVLAKMPWNRSKQ